MPRLWAMGTPYAGATTNTSDAQSVAAVGEDARAPPVETKDSQLPTKADPLRRTSWTGDRVALLAHLGLGAPGGALGAELDLAPIRRFAVNASGGFSPGGLQLAVTPRVRFELAQPEMLVGFGTGVSMGPYRSTTTSAGLVCILFCVMDSMGSSTATLAWDRAIWHNTEVSLDVYPPRSSTFFHLTLGYGYIVNSADRVCLDADASPNEFGPGKGCDRDSGQSLLYVSAAVGFDI